MTNLASTISMPIKLFCPNYDAKFALRADVIITLPFSLKTAAEDNFFKIFFKI